MELLDATIALAVTLAALATSVTMIMEIVVRVFGLKSKGWIELFTTRGKSDGDVTASDCFRYPVDHAIGKCRQKGLPGQSARR